MKPLKVDGRTLEGGGQLIRLFVGLSALTGRPVEISNIRGGRPGGGGLKAQHLAAVKWLASACGATIEGGTLKSRDLLFEPAKGPSRVNNALFRHVTDKQACEITLEVESAGAVTLVLQAIFPFLLFADAVPDVPVLLINLKGGTNVSFSPSVDYFLEVFSPSLTTLLRLPRPLITLEAGRELKRGWTHGGANIGEVTLRVERLPVATLIRGFDVSPARRGEPVKFGVVLLAPTTSACEKLETAVIQKLGREYPHIEARILRQEKTHNPKRYYLLVTAEMTSGLVLGADLVYADKIGKGLDAEDMAASRLAAKVTRDLMATLRSGAAVDPHLEDQLVVFQGLCSGPSEGCGDGHKSTLHTKTARWAVSEMVRVSFDEAGSCDGAALKAGCATSIQDLSASAMTEEVRELDLSK